MREDYVPSEKYRNMFGIERNGYGMERVDLYLAQLEVAFKKIREDNRSLKREFSAQPQPQPAAPDALMQQLTAQEQYIAQLQAQLAEQQELLAQLNESSAPAPRQDEQLLTQMEALRAEADDLRHQLRRQAAAPSSAPQPQYPAAPRFDAQDAAAQDIREEVIGKVLVDARTHAEEIRHAAKLEAEQTLLAAKQHADQTVMAAKQQANQTVAGAKQHADQTIAAAQQQVDALRTEKERTHTQLQEISYALRGVLRLSEPEFAPRSEGFAEE